MLEELHMMLEELHTMLEEHGLFEWGLSGDYCWNLGRHSMSQLLSEAYYSYGDLPPSLHQPRSYEIGACKLSAVGTLDERTQEL